MERQEFRIGDRVRWIGDGSPERKEEIGTVALVIHSDSDLPEFNIYDICFDFGTRTVYGSQLIPAPLQASN